MKRTTVPKVLLICVLCALLFNGTAITGEGPVGRWSGLFNGIGKKSSAAATFRSDGSCTLTALGISASGSYGKGKIKVSAYGYSMTLSYTYSGNRMIIFGKKGQYSGKMILKKQTADEETEQPEASAPAPSPSPSPQVSP